MAHDGVACAHVTVAILQGAEVCRAPDEQVGHDIDGGTLGGSAEDGQNLGVDGPLVRIAPHQREGERIEVGRNVSNDLRRRGPVDLLLAHQHFYGGDFERQAAGEDLEEHHADGVPIARGCQGRARRLFW